jgi:hypothetical protein
MCNVLALTILMIIGASVAETSPRASKTCSKKDIRHCKICKAGSKACAVCNDGYAIARSGKVCRLPRCGRSSVCLNAGVCKKKTCVCASGWTGKNCDVVVKDPCDPDPCQHGGVCNSNDDHTYTCSCAAGFWGPDCQLGSRCHLDSIFCDDFSRGNDLGWTLDAEWQMGTATASTPTDQTFFAPDPSYSPSPGNAVAGVNIGGNADIVIHDYYYLTSPAFDSSAARNPHLTFIRWLNSDMRPWMQNSVEVFDGNSWVVVDESRNYITDASWVYRRFDLTSYRTNSMRVRFGFKVGKIDGAFAVSSWNLARVDVHERLLNVQEEQGAAMQDGMNGSSVDVNRVP